MTPLKKDWVDITTPLVKHMQLQAPCVCLHPQHPLVVRGTLHVAFEDASIETTSQCGTRSSPRAYTAGANESEAKGSRDEDISEYN